MLIRNATLFLLGVSFFSAGTTYAQNKAGRKVVKQIAEDITYLASPELEGRRTGTAGEQKAAAYIEERYKKAGIGAYKGQYRYPFNFVYGKEIGTATQVWVARQSLSVPGDAFPLPFSAGSNVSSDVLPEVMEQGGIWLMPLFSDQEQSTNPHFDAEKTMFDRAKEAEKQGASGVLFYNSYNSAEEPVFNKQSIYEPLHIPVAFLKYNAWQKHIRPNEAGAQSSIPIELKVTIAKPERTGTNIAAYIDNKAPYTVVIGGHYDHLGYGEDENSRLANAVKEHQVHYGADDNASGTAGVLEVAKWVKQKKLHNYNYLFLNFSGEELGLFGSKAFIKDQKLDSTRIAYMINMDMVGRLNDSTHALEVGGIGTSPAWAGVKEMAGEKLRVKIDSSGTGPSDHTSFYNAGIPVLFFFTGLHTDYHKPSDIATRINYPGELQVLQYVHKVVAKMDKENVKPKYMPTKSKVTGGRTPFKVTLGIMPDYTYSDNGVRVDGVTDGKPAQVAGMKQGDVIVKLGAHKIGGMQSYMEALGKFSWGDSTEVTVIRDGKQITMPLHFKK
jgi:hypothetical protein